MSISLLKKGIYKIKNKDSKAVQYIRNTAQRLYIQQKEASPKRKRVIVKARQLGFTTEGCLSMLDKAMTTPFYSGFIIAHTLPDVGKIFQEKIKFPFEALPQSFKSLYKLVRDNSNEIRFNNKECQDSYVRVGMSARSSTVEDLHVTEAGKIGSDENRWRELVTGSFNAAQNIVMEGTAEGLNKFYDFVTDIQNDSNSEWDLHFYNWTLDKGYQTKAPDRTDWIQDYGSLAKRYFLCPDPMTIHKLTPDQFYWYYNKAKEQKELVVQEFPFTIEEAFKSSGNNIFNQIDILNAIQNAQKEYETIQGVTVWQKPVSGCQYVVGVDPSTGEGDDDSAISVWRFDTCEQVAEISGKLNPTETALVACNLANWYNQALLAIENNGNGIATVNEARKLEYPNLYRQFTPNATDVKGAKVPKYGWSTNLQTRPVMIEEFRQMFENGFLKVNSLKLLNQMKTFVRHTNGKVEHETGKHDDCLFAGMIAMQIRKTNKPVTLL
jgi:hypothetical protein